MNDSALLLRAGGIPREKIEDVLNTKLLAPMSSSGMHSPGQLERHYAPRSRLRLEAAAPRDDEIYLGFGVHAHGPYSLSPQGDVVEAAANLFRLLHEVDEKSNAGIAVAPIPMTGLGEAINDRLKRAAVR